MRNMSPNAINRCRSARGARRILAAIDLRVSDARLIGWQALEQAWQRERKSALTVMTRKGWI
jgi:hypothetical protein